MNRIVVTSTSQATGTTRRSLLVQLGAGALAGSLPAWALAADEDTYDQESTLKAATDFFGQTTEGLAKVIEKAFKDQGRPSGYIRGNEVAGATAMVS